MHVTQIELSERYIDPVDRRDCAQVWFHSDKTVTHMKAHARRAAPIPELVKDAVRQLRRMPEIRSGREVLSFASDCLAH